MIRNGMIALAILGMAAGAVAEDQPATGAPAPATAKKICHSEKVTGSRTKVRRICMTKAEWDELTAKTKRGLDEFNRGAAGGANSSWDPSNGPG